MTQSVNELEKYNENNNMKLEQKTCTRKNQFRDSNLINIYVIFYAIKSYMLNDTKLYVVT
jgi:hypothetical protein